PTGSGKTMSTVFPSIKALGENHCDQIIYLSAKVSGQQQAVNAVELMIAQGLDISYLVLQAKSRCCPCTSDDSVIDEMGRCQRCIGFFDRLPAARERLFNARTMTIEQIQKCATDFQLCPFELTLQMLEWVDIVICDFNYIFDPLVQLSYFKTSPRRKLLLIDELHNLVDRARDMYSSSLNRTQLKKAIASDNSKSISSALKKVQLALDKCLLEQLDEYSVSTDIPQPLLRACYQFSENLGQDLFSNKRISAETLEFAKSIFRFQCIAQLYDQHHRTIRTKPLPRRELKLLCLNAFEFLRECYPMFHAVCGFSATLSPGEYFRQALGMEREDYRLMIESSFPRAHQLVCIGDFVDGRYQQRDLHLDQICTAIQLCQRSRPGNYLAFFSSYYFMQQVYQRFGEMFPDPSTRIQQREFNALDQQQFLDSFQEGNNQIGFAIMGGRFAEGVDLPGKALIGAILVGVGLPQANQQQQLIAEDFETMQLNGFDHAFRYPGLIRVLQSAGRVIRSETDRGIILLLDQRFKQPDYHRNLPAHWQTTRCGSLEQLEQELDEFWQNSE
ncbi:MAG: DNA excision repair protein ERCC-2, partial [Gammaproteobacteria bacterium]